MICTCLNLKLKLNLDLNLDKAAAAAAFNITSEMHVVCQIRTQEEIFVSFFVLVI